MFSPYFEYKTTPFAQVVNFKMHKIGFIGGGKIAQAMAKGFIKAGKLFLIETLMLHNIIAGLQHSFMRSIFSIEKKKKRIEKIRIFPNIVYWKTFS